MTRIDWHPDTRSDIQRLYEFLYDRNPAAAAELLKTLRNGTEILSANPRIGRPMPDETARRELFLSFGAGHYVLRYRQTNSGIFILLVWHNREDR